MILKCIAKTEQTTIILQNQVTIMYYIIIQFYYQFTYRCLLVHWHELYHLLTQPDTVQWKNWRALPFSGFQAVEFLERQFQLLCMLSQISSDQQLIGRGTKMTQVVNLKCFFLPWLWDFKLEPELYYSWELCLIGWLARRTWKIESPSFNFAAVCSALSVQWALCWISHTFIHNTSRMWSQPTSENEGSGSFLLYFRCSHKTRDLELS